MKRLLSQLTRIRNYNATHDGIHLFAGVECDIRRDGSLDFPDEILAQLDYVIASVHSSFTLSEAAMTNRIIMAMSNPYVTMLGHVSGRMPLCDASLTRSALLPSSKRQPKPARLSNSMPTRAAWIWTGAGGRFCQAKGVKCAINPDAHSVSSLQNLIFGVGAARKGWLSREDVINTLPLGQIEES